MRHRLRLLVGELGRDNGFTAFAAAIFRIMPVGSAIALVFYAPWRIQSIVKAVRAKPDPAAAFGAPAAAPGSISLL